MPDTHRAVSASPAPVTPVIEKKRMGSAWASSSATCRCGLGSASRQARSSVGDGPAAAGWLSRFTYAQISIPVTVLIWLMIYPMMLQIDFASLRRVGEKKQGLIVTTVSNWLIKPFTMYAICTQSPGSS